MKIAIRRLGIYSFITVKESTGAEAGGNTGTNNNSILLQSRTFAPANS